MWKYLGSPGFSEGLASGISLAVDKRGNAYVAYSDSAKDGKATLMQHTGKGLTGWGSYAYGTPGFSPGQASGVVAIALDSLGIPYVAFTDSANEQKVTVMKYTESGYTGWEAVGSPGFSKGTAYDVAMSIDNNGTPYVSFQDCAKGQKVTVMKYTGNGVTGWENVGSPGFSPRSAYGSSVRLDNSGIPYVVYASGESESKVTVCIYTGEGTVGWKALGSPMFSSDGDRTNMVMDHNGTPYVSYRDYDNGEGPTVMKYTGNGDTGWETVGSPGFSGGPASEIALALNDKGIPYVAYVDKPNDKMITVKKYTGTGATGWETVGNPSAPFSNALFVSMVADDSGRLFVAYQDWNNGRKVSVIYYDITVK